MNKQNPLFTLPTRENTKGDTLNGATLPDFTRGCYICTKKSDTLNRNGLTEAHIFAKSKAVSNCPWNIIPLCPSCHQAFDGIIKPMLVNAIQIALNGYKKNPKAPNAPLTIKTVPDIIDALK